MLVLSRWQSGQNPTGRFDFRREVRFPARTPKTFPADLWGSLPKDTHGRAVGSRGSACLTCDSASKALQYSILHYTKLRHATRSCGMQLDGLKVRRTAPTPSISPPTSSARPVART